MAALYDLVLPIDADAPDGRRETVVGEAQGMIEQGGELVGSHEWGTRRMAYEIDHHAEAAYHVFQFRGENELLERLGHSLKIMEGVLRFRIVRLKEGAPPPPAPPAPREAAPRPREDEEEGGRVAARAAADKPAGGDEPAAGEPAEDA